MRRHLLRVEMEAAEIAPIIQAAAAEGLRVGWLQLDREMSPATPPELETAAAAGALRAVAVGGGRAIALKPMRGQAVLRDLLREYFTGCALVLIQGAAKAPLLASDGQGGWKILGSDGSCLRSLDRLVGDLRKPDPWGVADP
jgi:hypothetical protein